MRPLYPLNRAFVSLLILLLLSALAFQSRAQNGAVTTTQSFPYTGQIVTWTVPTGVTSLTIEARGAEGGNSSGNAGKGAIIRGGVTVTPGQQLSILVGRSGATFGGGGGGSFVVTGANPLQPLVIAGGGGGSGGISVNNGQPTYDSNDKHGQAGTTGSKAPGPTAVGGAGGTSGTGGQAGTGNYKAGGGGGLLTDGQSGGRAFVNGGAGGFNSNSSGGFGGGGAGISLQYVGYSARVGGGGGGYSGGGGSSNTDGQGAGVGGGGGSFNAGANQTNTPGANSGDGLVTITYALPPQPIRYVKQNGLGSGTSWDDASGDLQSQIDIAGAEQVWVAGGRYTTTANNGSFSLKNGVAVYGGFRGGENSLGDRPGINPINGQPSSTTLTATSVSVVFNDGLTNTARLDGVVITGGNSSQSRGIYNLRSSPVLTNCTISGNSGGGIYNIGGNPVLTNCVISGNSASNGGGISSFASSPVLTNCLISGNTAERGGGIFNDSRSNSELINCLMIANSANTGGGIFNFNSSPRLINSTLTANRAGVGAALISYVGSQPMLTNCILWDNQEATGTSINSDREMGVTANYCLIGQGEPDYTGNNNSTATVSPFMSSTDFTLKAGSQAIDAGDPASTSSGATDLAGNPRVFNNRIDQGAYESQVLPQPIRYVKQGGTGDGTSWTNASGDLQSQIDIAGAQQVWVAAGTYKPGPDNNANRTISFVMKNGVAIYGGFVGDGTEDELSDRPAVNPFTSRPFSSMLSGDIGQVGDNIDNSNRVVSSDGLTASARLDGFVITGANNPDGTGGGMYNRNSSPTLANLSFSQNQARFGGGIFNEVSSPVISNCDFSQNQSTVQGGGIYNDRSSPTITGVRFSQNTTGDGGGLYNDQSNSTLINCTFIGNLGIKFGGAMVNISSAPSLINCTFTANRSASGAVVLQNLNSRTRLTNCILWDNGGSNAIINQDNSSVTANYCLIEPAETDYTGTNNRALDPLFVDAASGNLQLQPCSPAIDAGDNSANSTATDLAGNPRRQRTIDMGSLEFQGTPNQPVAITQQPVSGSSVTVGASVSVPVSVSGSVSGYQWYKNNLSSPVAGQTSATLTLTNVQLGDAGSYSLVVTGACNSVTSTAFSLSVVNPVTPLTVTLSASPTQLLTTQSTTLTAAVSGGTSPYSYTFAGPGTITPTGNTASVANLPAGVQTFTVIVADATTPTSQTTSGTVSVTVSQAVSAPFAITGVTTVNCSPIQPNRFSISFTPRYQGLDGSPVSFSVTNELFPTTEPGPYTLQLYSDNPVITLEARQSGVSSRFAYNWLEACNSSTSPNTPPRVAMGIPSQTATVGQYVSYVIPDGTFTDDQTPGSLKLSASGLPPGLSFKGATLSGTPSSTVGSPFSVTITATDPGSLSASSSFELTVLPATGTPPPTAPFAITGVTTISCTPVANRINLVFSPRYAGMTGQPIALEVVNELAPTTDPAPYSLTLYRDNSVITLRATQTGSPGPVTFRYEWLAACSSAGQENTPPRLNEPVRPQSARVGVEYSLNLTNTFIDQETPDQISLSVVGLPAGLTLSGKMISGTPSMSGVSSVTLTATDGGGLSTSTSFTITVQPGAATPPPNPTGAFSITSVQTLSCVVVSSGQRSVRFQPQYAGLNGQAITFSVVNELSPTTASDPYTLQLYTDNPVITLKASQAGSPGEASFSYNWLGACNSGTGARRGAESLTPLRVVVLGNPVVDETVAVEVRGAAGEPLRLQLFSAQGNRVDQRGVEQARAVERFTLRIGPSTGVYLLRVVSGGRSQTLKIVKQ